MTVQRLNDKLQTAAHEGKAQHKVKVAFGNYLIDIDDILIDGDKLVITTKKLYN